MGCISFLVFIIFNSPLELSHGDTFIIFEFAHIVLFFLAFFFVLRACSAVHYTRKAKSYFQHAHNTTAVSLCKSFVEVEMHPYSLKALVLRYGGLLSPIERTFEYRVLEDFFFKQFPLIPEEFRFVDYLSKRSVYDHKHTGTSKRCFPSFVSQHLLFCFVLYYS